MALFGGCASPQQTEEPEAEEQETDEQQTDGQVAFTETWKPPVDPEVYNATQLPPCPGPKLRAFYHPNAPITWLERLDWERAEASGREFPLQGSNKVQRGLITVEKYVEIGKK